jgi:hypothetical protein
VTLFQVALHEAVLVLVATVCGLSIIRLPGCFQQAEIGEGVKLPKLFFL